MIDSIAIQRPVRTNLAGVQKTQRNVDSTNAQLGTGSKIGGGMSSHNNDEVTLIHSTELYDRASAFDQNKGDITQGIDAIKTVSTGLDSAGGMVDLMKAYVGGMQTAENGEDYDALQDSLKETASQYDDMLKDAKYGGQSYLNNDKASSTIRVSPNPENSIKLQGIDVSSTNPNINLNGALTEAAKGGDALEGAKDLLDNASETLKASNIEFGAKTSLLQSRQSFDDKYSDVMSNSADEETDIDDTQTAAKLMASNVQNQLSQNSLALSGKQGAFVLNLVNSTS